MANKYFKKTEKWKAFKKEAAYENRSEDIKWEKHLKALENGNFEKKVVNKNVSFVIIDNEIEGDFEDEN